MHVVVYHNPKCSKSMQTLRLLESYGIAPEIIEYLHTPPSEDELGRILAALAMEPRDLMRRTEPEYQRLRLDDPDLLRAALIRALHMHPRLIGTTHCDRRHPGRHRPTTGKRTGNTGITR